MTAAESLRYCFCPLRRMTPPLRKNCKTPSTYKTQITNPLFFIPNQLLPRQGNFSFFIAKKADLGYIIC